MANSDAPHGLRPISTLSGGAFYIEEFAKAVGFGTAAFIGDTVARQADGSIQSGGTPGTTRITGVNLNFGAASTATTHAVVTGIDTVFEAQDNNDTDGIAAADLGLNANIENNAGSTSTQLSGYEIDESTANTTNTLDVHLLRLYNSPDNAHSGWARIEILINKHRFAQDSVGV